MTRQLVDVLRECQQTNAGRANALVASLLTGLAEHTIDCPTCFHGKVSIGSPVAIPEPCPDCTNGKQTIIVRAEVKR